MKNDLTSPSEQAPTRVPSSSLTEPVRANPSEPPQRVETNPNLYVPLSVAGRSPTPEYKPPASAQRADREVPVYQPDAPKFSNIVEVDE